jgi:hypothetical protein
MIIRNYNLNPMSDFRPRYLGCMRSTFSQKMIRSLLLVLLFVAVQIVRAVEVNVPADWTTLEVPSERPSSIKSMIRVLAPAEDAEVSINEMEIVMSMDEAAESFIRGATKRGFRHSSTSKLTHNDHEARHITGTLKLPEGDEELPIEAYIILGPDSMMTVSVTGQKASSMINDVLTWIELPTAETTPTTEPEVATTGRSLWEYLGMGLVIAAVAYAVINANSHKKKKENKS